MAFLKKSLILLFLVFQIGLARAPEPPPFVPTTEMLTTDYCFKEVVCFPRTRDVEKHELKLESFGWKPSRYAVALYLLPGPKTYDEVLVGTPRSLTIQFLGSISQKSLVKRHRKIFLKNKMNKEQILRAIFHDFLAEIPGAAKGDVWEITYEPHYGTYLKVNSEIRARMPGEEPARAYFDLWLGDKPFDKKVQRELSQGLSEVPDPELAPE